MFILIIILFSQDLFFLFFRNSLGSWIYDNEEDMD